MSIATEIQRLLQAKADIKTSIEAKGVSVAANATLDDYSEAVDQIQQGGGGGGSASPKDVNFYDYDGTITNSYTAAEFLALSAMPDNPSHSGLVAQGWNWSFSDAQDYVTDYGKLNIGQMYITASGDTEIDIELHYGRLEPYLGICPNGTVEIDWGDGGAKDTVTGTSLSTVVNTQHVYANEGSYTIKLHVVSGSFAISGTSDYGTKLLWSNQASSNYNVRVYQNAIKAVRIGESMTRLTTHSFRYCYSLENITIPNGVTSDFANAFYNCYSLKYVTIPTGTTNISSTFNACYSLQTVSLPNTITDVGSSSFYYCYSLEIITIPDNVMNLGSNAFYYCYSLHTVVIPNSITTIDSSVFRNCSSLESINVPNATRIGDSMFYYCYSLHTAVIPNSATYVGSQAFYYCYSLTAITIPNNVNSIGSGAFQNCFSLKYLIFLSTTPPVVANSSAFLNFPADAIVYVPQGTLEAYQSAANYSGIANQMVEMT